MCFFWKKKNIENSHESNRRESKKERINRECEELYGCVYAACDEAYGYFANPDAYIDPSTCDYWKSKYGFVSERLAQTNIKSYHRAIRFEQLRDKTNQFHGYWNGLPQQIANHNSRVAEQQIQDGYNTIGDVEGRQLDKQQMIAIVKPANNHLIIAGAGTGKTTTIVGKIKYILRKNIYRPEDILVLSFTHASAEEMSERIDKETGIHIDASTFHKLGLDIINAVEGAKPKIYSKSISTFVKEQLQTLMSDSRYMELLCKYAVFYRNPLREESDFENHEEYVEYLSKNAPKTLRGETVKSYGEMDIANFLYQNQISYEYEASYQFNTNTREYGQYHPDFYLKDYNVYIEYFGIDRNGRVADYFTAKDGMSASQTYQSGMEWKRKTHAAYQTKMIECYAYEKFEDTLLDNLSMKLSSFGVTLNSLSPDEVWNKVASENNGILEGIIELFGTVISLIKSNDYSFEYFEQIASVGPYARYNMTLISLLKPIYQAYDKMLKENDEIDFNDMINVAVEYVRQGKYINPYKYVIVDEYQDISKARFNLLAALRQSSFYELFCVGDDWQSIYRFAGSDINFIVDFEKYWGATEKGKIETTYRFTNSLIDISSSFIMQNPRQIKKQIYGMSQDMRFSLEVINGYTDKNAIQFMCDKLDELPANATVYFLGRYNFDKDLLSDNSSLRLQYDNKSGEFRVSYYKRRDLQMQFLTAHRSKGLQADYVFIINNKNSKMGFPSKIQDAPIMDLLLEAKEEYPYAEERRLFYVALTRAKTKVFLLTVKGHESEFAIELMNRYSKQLNDVKYTCPLCGGRLIKKSGPYGEFFGCTSYSTLGCKYIRKIGNKI